MFRMERKSSGNQASSELTNNPTPASWPNNASLDGAGAHTQVPVQASATPRAMTEGELLTRDIKEGKLNGFIGHGTVVTGEASFKGMLRVDGHFTGQISSEDGVLIVGTNGQVDADIEVAEATIYGKVKGDITATKRIEMGRTAQVIGNIQTPTLVTEQGAIFEGSCRMLQIKKAQDQQRESERSVNTPPRNEAIKPAESSGIKISHSVTTTRAVG